MRLPLQAQMILNRSIEALLRFGMVVMFVCIPACWSVADFFSAPEKATYTSPNGRFEWVVSPGITPSPPETSEQQQNRSTPELGEFPYSNATGEFRGIKDGLRKNLWKRNLANRIAPSDALISDSGRYIVTFGDWGDSVRSKNIVVIYDSNGEVVKRFSINDLLTEQERKNVTRSASRVHWGGKHHIDEIHNQLVLQIVTNRKRPESTEAQFKSKWINLSNGDFVTNDSRPR